MADETVEFRVTNEFYDASEGVYRRRDDTFGAPESFAAERGELVEPTGEDGRNDGGEAEGADSSDESDEEALTDLEGVGEKTADRLRGADFETVADVRDTDPEVLADIDGITDSTAADLTTADGA